MSVVAKPKLKAGIEILLGLPMTTTNKIQKYKLREDLVAKYGLKG